MTGFRINVQIDALPDRVAGGVRTRSVGVRLSAAVEPNAAVPAAAVATTADDLDALLPWQWLDAGGGGGAWDPASPSAWQVWSIKPLNAAGQPQIWPPPVPPGPAPAPPVAPYGPRTRRDPARPLMGPSLPAASGTPLKFVDWCTRAVQSLLTPFDPTRLEWRAVPGGPGGLPGGPSVCGFVENLATLPAPVPEALSVFIVFDLPAGVEQVVIAPLFAMPRHGGSSVCTVANGAVPAWSQADGAWVLPYTLNNRADAARAMVRRVTPPAAPGARIMQEPAFLISGAQDIDWAAATTEDWMTPLPRRLAALLDPLRAFSEALEQVIAEAVEQVIAEARQANSTVPAPSSDQITALRRMLAAIAWRLLSRSACATTAMTLLAPAALRDLLAPNGQPGPLVQTLAAWSLRDAGAGPADTLPGFALPDPGHPDAEAISVWTASRLTALFTGAAPNDGQTVRQIASPGGLRGWLMGHWAAQPPGASLPAGQSLDVLRAAGTQWAGGGRAVDHAACYGLLDLRPFAAAKAFSFNFTLQLTVPAAGGQLSFRLRAEDSLINPPDLAAVIIVPVAAGAADQTVAVTLTFAYPAQPPVPDPPATFTVQVGQGPAVQQTVEPAWRNSRAFVTLGFTGAGAVTVSAAPAGQPMIEGLLANLSETVLRDNAALLFAGPALAQILAGKDPTGAGPPATVSSSPVAVIRWAFAAFAARLFEDECAAAIKLSPAADAGTTVLFSRARDRATANVIARGDALFDAAGRSADAAAYAVTPKAVPVVVPIDQPQPFDDADDLWTKFAGAGVLVASSPGPVDWTSAPGSGVEPATWYSLNAAELHVVEGSKDGQISFGDENPARNATIVPPVGDANALTYFDPVPAQIAEMGGVRAACITYENRGLVGVMPHDPIHDEGGAAATPGPRRIDAYAFPYGGPDSRGNRQTVGSPGRYRTGALLPALSFGKSFHFLPYLIGHGGTLPNCLWDSGPSPSRTKLARNADASVRLDMNQIADYAASLNKNRAAFIRKVDYRRTTPVGPPRLFLVPPGSGNVPTPQTAVLLPAVPDGVAPLAAELPVTPSPISLNPGEKVFFYADPARAEGLLNFPSTEARALRIVFAPMPPPPAGVAVAAAATLIVAVRGRVSTTGAAAVVDTLWQSNPITFTPGLGAVVMLAATPARLPQPPAAGPPLVASVSPAIDIDTWRDFYLTVASPAGPAPAVTLIPPVAGFGMLDAAGATFARFTDVAAAEFGEQKRKIVLLDGMDGAARPTTETILKIRPPSTDFGTYERWINWDVVAATPALDAAHRLVTRAAPAGMDLSLPDPAVADIAIEVVRLFPTPENFGVRLLGANWRPVPLSTLDFTRAFVTFTIAAEAGAPEDFVPAGGVATGFRAVKGSIYEIRIHGAVPCAAQPGIAKPPPDRFGAGAWQGLRQIGESPKQYRLGAPLTVTVEIATDAMPVFYDADAFQLVRDAGNANGGDTATWRMKSRFADPINAVRLRYVDRLALLSQHWSWRGHALPPLPDASVFGVPASGPARLNLAAAGFRGGDAGRFEAGAFIDRRIDDIGVIEEVRPTAGQLLGPDTAAPLLVKDLHYSGGAHWWRFAMRATSRYAAMRPDKPDLVRFSHQGSASDTPRWLNLLVTDRDTGRAVKRPMLLFVVPLTEPLMAGGAVPPLLAIFDEPAFAGGHIGDGLEAAIAYARQPLFVLPRQDPLASQIVSAAADLQTKANDACASPGDAGKRAGWFLAAQTLLNSAAQWAYQAALMFAGSQQDALAGQIARAAQDLQNKAKDVYMHAGDAGKLALCLAAAKTLDGLTAGWAPQSTAPAGPTYDELKDANALTQISVSIFTQEPRRDLGFGALRRHWPEFGPDPILTGIGHAGTPVPVRLDGPLGYTFDTDTEAANFGRSGFMITPVPAAGVDAAWSLIKLQFRRLEAIETSSNPPAAVTDGNGVPVRLRLREPAGVVAPGPMSAADAAAHTPAGCHEGLVIDFGVLGEPRRATLKIAPGPRAAASPAGSFTIETKLDGDQLAIALSTDLGTAGGFPVTLAPSREVRLRLVVSQRDAPADAAAPYAPVLDVAVRLLIDDGAAADRQDPRTGAWLTLACLPVLAGVAGFLPSDPIFVTLEDRLTATGAPPPPSQGANAIGVRLSSFTPPHWCQFTQDRSRFAITTAGSGAAETVSILDLAAAATPTGAPGLSWEGNPVTSLAWLRADASAQVMGEVAIVVTSYFTDAMNQRRERPVAIYRVVNSAPPGAQPYTTETMWPAAGEAAAPARAGRVRLMTLMRRAPAAGAAGAAEPAQKLADYFNGGAIDAIDMNGTDAFGRIVGISRPIPLPDPAPLR